jgi:hypothetical protein
MLAFKFALYVLTLGIAFFFGFWELRLKHQLTDEALEQHQGVSDYGVLHGLSRKIRRERLLKNLAPDLRFKLRMLAILKLVFLAILIVEVILFQR